MAEQVQVLIPTALRAQAGDQATLTLSGGCVGDVLNCLRDRYPSLGQRLFKNGPGSELNRFINVYVNDEDIRFLDNLATCLRAGDEVALIPAIAGG